MKEKMYLINKIFANETIRTIWNKEDEKYYISVVDIVGVLSESKDAQSYWRKLKQRLKEEGNESVTNCHGLKLKARDGKYRLTDVWKDGGILSNLEYAILTNEIYKSWSGFTAKEYKQHKGLRKESLRDNMTDIEIALADLSELTIRDIALSEHPEGLKENINVAKRGGQVALGARTLYEKETKKSAISNQNALNYKYTEKNKQINN